MKILALDLGGADLPPQGYTPSMFLPDLTTTAQSLIYFVSNGVQHVVTPSGPVAINRPEPHRVSPVGLIVLGALVVITATFLARLYVRRGRARTKHQTI